MFRLLRAWYVQKRSGILPKTVGLRETIKGYVFKNQMQSLDADFTEEGLHVGLLASVLTLDLKWGMGRSKYSLLCYY